MKLYRQPFTASIKSQSGSDRKESNGGNKKQIIKIQDYGQHQGKQGVPARQRLGKIVKSNEGEELLIGSTALLDALHPGSFEDESEGFASKEAEQIYDEVFFFADAKTLKLPDDELITELKEDNPEWFN